MMYRLLGPLEVVRVASTADPAVPSSESQVDLGPRKQRAVLAVLLLNRGRVISTDRLIDALRQDEAPASAMASIQAYISNLRRVLRGESGAASPIVRQPPGQQHPRMGVRHPRRRGSRHRGTGFLERSRSPAPVGTPGR